MLVAKTWIDIVNSALVRIGVSKINDLEEGSKQAADAKLFLRPAYRDVLGRADWTFAMKRATLARLAEAPACGYLYAYRKPIDLDHIATIYTPAGEPVPAFYVADETFDVREEGQDLLTNSPTLSILYIAEQDTPAAFAEKFAKAVSALLAHELGTATAHSDALAGVLLVEAEKKIDEAIYENADRLPGLPAGAFSYEARA